MRCIALGLVVAMLAVIPDGAHGPIRTPAHPLRGAGFQTRIALLIAPGGRPCVDGPQLGDQPPERTHGVRGHVYPDAACTLRSQRICNRWLQERSTFSHVEGSRRVAISGDEH